ncbi:hypothetical protein II654_02000, partial [bacterium]|nr:hypothetical protein [bacterium]
QQINYFGFQGLTIKHLDMNYFLNLTLFFPNNIHEQIKILEFLNLIDQKIENIKQQKNCLEQYRSYLLKNMFV